MKRKYENVEIKKLKPYKNNARTHSSEQVQKIADSISEFGFINPVLIDGDYGIIAGHGRVLGARALGMTEVPCLFVEDLTEAQKRAYILADNKIAEQAGWDDEILRNELLELEQMDFDFTLTGFDKIDDFDNVEEEEFGTDFVLDNSDCPKSRTISISLCEEQYQDFIQIIEEASEMFGDIYSELNANKKSNIIYEIVRRWGQDNA